MMVWIVGLLVLYLLVILAVTWISVRPFRTPIYFGPGALGLPQEEIKFRTSDDLELKGWWVVPKDPVAIIVMSHGYAMNRSEMSPLAIRLFELGCASLVYDFRAHGRSPGKRCGCGVFEAEDVCAAVEYAKSRLPGVPVVLIGSSMGAAASALAVAKHPHLSSMVVLDCSYSRLPSAVLGWWRFLGGRPLAFLLSPTVLAGYLFNRVNPFKVDIAKAIEKAEDTQFLLLHGDQDTLALPSEAVRNRDAAPDRCKLVWLPKCGHAEGRWVHPNLYEGSVIRFLLDNQVPIRQNQPVCAE